MFSGGQMLSECTWVSRPAEQRQAGSSRGQSGGGSPGAMPSP